MFSCQKVHLLSPFLSFFLSFRTWKKPPRSNYHQRSEIASYFLKSLLFQIRQCSSSAAPFSNPASPTQMRALIDTIAFGVGNLEDMETILERTNIKATADIITRVIHSCKALPSDTNCGSSRSRRLFRFFSWCIRRNCGGIGDDVFNCAITAFTEMKDLTAMGIAISELWKAGCRMYADTFVLAIETLVKADKPDEAVHLFRSIVEKQMQLLPPQGRGGWSCITAVVHALCSKGYVRKAEGIVWHHKDKLQEETGIVYRSLLHGWCIHRNVREAKRILKEMKSRGINPGLASYNDLLLCICHRNLKFNPSGLVSEATDLMMEMRSSGVTPTTVSFNILLSCLSRARRVKETRRILSSMKQGEVEASPDQVTYYLVLRVLYLTDRIMKGNRIVDHMIRDGMVLEARFFHNLIGILCGTENIDCALKMFEKMKICCRENMGSTYDLLIEKLCRNGKFDEGRRLYDEAIEKNVILKISKDLLDPLKTLVFKPTRSEGKLHLSEYRSKVLSKRTNRFNKKN